MFRVCRSSDDDLVAAVRSGDLDAYGTLFGRHRPDALRYARHLLPAPADEDAVSTAYLGVLEAIQRGRGPAAGAFRPYLLVAVRNAAFRESERQARCPVSDLSEEDAGETFVDTALTEFDTSLIRRAYAGLSPQYQTVLWHTAVEGEPPLVVARLLHSTPRRTAALACRARDALAGRYLQLHAADTGDERCRYTVERMSGWVRDTLTERESDIVRRHLDGCARCRDLAAELRDVNRSLRAVLWPLLAGTPLAVDHLVTPHRPRRVPSPSAAVAAVIGAGLAIAAGAVVALSLAGFSRAPGPGPGTAVASLVVANASTTPLVTAQRVGTTPAASPSPATPSHSTPSGRSRAATPHEEQTTSVAGPPGTAGATVSSPLRPAGSPAPGTSVAAAPNVTTGSTTAGTTTAAPPSPTPTASANCVHGRKVGHPECA